MLREYRGDGFDNCGIPAGMDFITAGTPRQWWANLLAVIIFYLTSSNADASDSDLLAYWPIKDKAWRKLVKVARGLLSVPASSTSSERSFSLAGCTLADRRSRLSPELVDGLMFLHGVK